MANIQTNSNILNTFEHKMNKNRNNNMGLLLLEPAACEILLPQFLNCSMARDECRCFSVKIHGNGGSETLANVVQETT